jgi:predicted ferric reductase
MTATTGWRPPAAPVHVRARRRRSTLADVTGAAALASLVFVVALWLADGGIQTLAQPGGLALTTGRLTGLLSADLLLIQVLLMARIPWVERAWGQDVLARRHRTIGYWSFHLMIAHIVLIVIGYTQSGTMSLLPQTWDLVVNYPGMLLAVAGTVALIAVVVTSIRAARRRMRYESWHLIHLYAYLGVGLALPHQLWTGDDFLTSAAATVFWWTLWGAAAGAIVAFRLLLPLARSAFHALRVEAVVPEGPGVVSVIMRGRHLGRLAVRPGQFLHWRFLGGPGWTRAHPYSVSAGPSQDRIRITASTAGDDGSRLARIRPGARVLVEGPYGGLTADRRRHRDVLLVAAGLGITPMRALAEQIAAEPAMPGPGGAQRPSVVVLHRVSAPGDAIFGAELSALSRWADIRPVYLIGPRPPGGGWLPAAAAHTDPAEALRRIVPDVTEREVYLCGPPGWMASVTATLRTLGVPPGSIHREDFTW